MNADNVEAQIIHQALMMKHVLTVENAKIFDAALEQIATAANGKLYPGGFLMSARKDDPSGAAAHQAAKSAAGKLGGKLGQKTAAIEARAPIETGNRASKADAIISLLGHKAAAKAGKTGWPAIVDSAVESRKLGSKTSAIRAVKAGAPTQKNGGASKKSAMIWKMSGGNKSSFSTWAQRATAATAVTKKGSEKGQSLATKASSVARSTKAVSAHIATHSHECKHPGCRHPVKITSKMVGGREYPNLNHRCLETNGVMVGGLKYHLCSTSHRTGLVCKDRICRSLKCTSSRPDCVHLHDGSGIQRK